MGLRLPQESLEADVEMDTSLSQQGCQLQERDVADGQPLSVLTALSIAPLALRETRPGSNASQTTTCVSRRIT